MQWFIADQANLISYDVVDKDTGDAVTTGTVTFYLLQDVGTNAGKWFRASDSTWQAAAASAGAGAHKDKSLWQVSVVAGAWEAGAKYSMYASESLDADIPHTIPMYDIASAGLGSGGGKAWIGP